MQVGSHLNTFQKKTKMNNIFLSHNLLQNKAQEINKNIQNTVKETSRCLAFNKILSAMQRRGGEEKNKSKLTQKEDRVSR